MPNGANSDEEKIILNGGVAEKVLGETCYTIKRHVDEYQHAATEKPAFPNAPKLVTIANALEDLAFLFQREVLDQIGFDGPYSHAINRQIDTIQVSETEIRVVIKPATGTQAKP